MTQKRQGILLPFLCALALIVLPLSHATIWAQSSQQPAQTDQDKQDLDRAQEQNQNPDINREKPSTSTESNVGEAQTQTRTESTTEKSTTTTEKQRTETERSNQADADRSDLPATAGELPLLALIGFLSIIMGFGTRALAKLNR